MSELSMGWPERVGGLDGDPLSEQVVGRERQVGVLLGRPERQHDPVVALEVPLELHPVQVGGAHRSDVPHVLAGSRAHGRLVVAVPPEPVELAAQERSRRRTRKRRLGDRLAVDRDRLDLAGVAPAERDRAIEPRAQPAGEQQRVRLRPSDVELLRLGDARPGLRDRLPPRQRPRPHDVRDREVVTEVLREAASDLAQNNMPTEAVRERLAKIAEVRGPSESEAIALIKNARQGGSEPTLGQILDGVLAAAPANSNPPLVQNNTGGQSNG